MIGTVVELVILGLATNQVVEIWHHSTLLARPRAMVQLWQDEDNGSTKEKIVELLLCPWCLSVWAAGILFALGRLPGMAGWLVWFLTTALAVSRVSNFIADAEKRTRKENSSTELQRTDRQTSDAE